MTKLKIGVLIPYSGLYKNLRSDFMNGLELALPKSLKKNITLLPEYIQSGSHRQVDNAYQKLVRFEAVDLITGIVETSGLLPLIGPSIEDQMPLLISNLGAYVPPAALSSDFLFYNSLHLWKSQWAMGKWAQEQYGGNPSIGTSLYDVGYHLHECFRLGSAAAGAEQYKLYTLKNLAGSTDTTALVNALRAGNAPHAHISLTGVESEQFLRLFYEDTELVQQLPLSLNPFMVDEGIKIDHSFPAQGVPNALTWSPDLETKENKNFLKLYRKAHVKTPGIFSLLGYETGMAITAAAEITAGQAPDRTVLAEALGRIQTEGPRGSIIVQTENLQTGQPVYVRMAKKSPSTGMISNHIVATAEGTNHEDPMFASLTEVITGWLNPYLCV
ncbi:ABC transporter substrate-binding protein [Hufsiella ginkgonis]|uniref:ABC transporter substrate-binding protein n=1 Tax=Hufsiella ginkgonis TaxID=2695274 RepID=A0A7K1Y1E6_9SPHI|nr:ABC transporter substrate-binding protein [Hufsiella ginkgonis]MXV17051.1 ABC transporter substrate-binding protein [Hufsiella ginkgonis]